MKSWRKIAAVVLLLGILGVVGCFGRKKEKVLRADSKDLPNTIITPHLEAKIVPGKNLIYCSTFQFAWNELRDNIIKEDIRLENEPAIVKYLNKKMTTKGDISEDCYVAMAGFGRDRIIEKINEALKAKFGPEAPTVVEENFMPHYILAYAFLLKDLKFANPFESLKKPIRFQSQSGAAKVRAFGTRDHWPPKPVDGKLLRQVRVLDYEYGTGEFVIQLISQTPSDEIVLAKVQPQKTLLGTIGSVEKRIENGRSEFMGELDVVQIPKVDLDVTHSYSQLLRRFFLNQGFTDYFIAKARQDIRFRLSEKGAMLRSEARIRAECDSKRLIFDGPFLLYLKEKQGKYPYLAIWVAHPEILLKK